MKWQLIDTAPKDKRILVFAGKSMYVGIYAQHTKTNEDCWIVAEFGDNGERALIVKPTHWHPLPEPPKTMQLVA